MDLRVLVCDELYQHLIRLILRRNGNDQYGSIFDTSTSYREANFVFLSEADVHKFLWLIYDKFWQGNLLAIFFSKSDVNVENI
jgi:hypothetical protein